MTRATALATLLSIGCSQPSSGWVQTVELPLGTAPIIDAVGRMPECQRVREGGVIHWRPGDFDCRPGAPPAKGCSWPGERPPRVDLAYREYAKDSSLAHELCHVCGYVDEVETEACAFRALQTVP